MKQINGTNFQTLTPGDILGGIGTAYNIIETALPGLIAIANHIAAAFKNGPRIKRIRALEEAQIVTNLAIAEAHRINEEQNQRLLVLEGK
jgi:hypothetical protein